MDPKWCQNVTQDGSFHGTKDGVCGSPYFINLGDLLTSGGGYFFDFILSQVRDPYRKIELVELHLSVLVSFQTELRRPRTSRLKFFMGSTFSEVGVTREKT